MSCLSRDQVLAFRQDLPRDEVQVPELGEGATVFVRVMTLAEVGKIQSLLKSRPDDGLATYPHMLIASACDEEGKPLFTDKDIDAVKRLPFPAVERIVTAAQRVTQTSDSQADAARKN